MPISEFWVDLRGTAYQANIGWACSALTLPGAIASTFMVANQEMAATLFVVDAGHLRYRAPLPNPIPDVAVKIALTKRLVTLDATIVVALIGLVGTLVTAYLTTRGGSDKNVTAPPEPSNSFCVLRPLGTRGYTNPAAVSLRLEFAGGSIPARHVWIAASEVGNAGDVEVRCDDSLNAVISTGNAMQEQIDSQLGQMQDVLSTWPGRHLLKLGKGGELEYEVFKDVQMRPEAP